MRRLTVTAMIAAGAAVIWLLIGIPLGVASGVDRSPSSPAGR